MKPIPNFTPPSGVPEDVAPGDNDGIQLVPYTPLTKLYCPGCGHCPPSIGALDKHIAGSNTQDQKACPQFLLIYAWFVETSHVDGYDKVKKNGQKVPNKKKNYLMWKPRKDRWGKSLQDLKVTAEELREKMVEASAAMKAKFEEYETMLKFHNPPPAATLVDNELLQAERQRAEIAAKNAKAAMDALVQTYVTNPTIEIPPNIFSPEQLECVKHGRIGHYVKNTTLEIPDSYSSEMRSTINDLRNGSSNDDDDDNDDESEDKTGKKRKINI